MRWSYECWRSRVQEAQPFEVNCLRTYGQTEGSKKLDEMPAPSSRIIGSEVLHDRPEAV